MKALVIDRSLVRHNISVVKARADGTPIYAVVKGDGYGLGLLELAKILREEGVSRFAITEPGDAVALRSAGFTEEEILMLRPTADPEELDVLMDQNVVATIASHDDAVALNGLAERRGTVAEAHIKLDTGMGRYGFLPQELDKILSLYQYMPNLAFTGIYTHFYAAFGREREVRAQVELFDGALARLRARGIDPGTVHAANSSCLFRFDFARYDAVRVGSAFTGRLPTGGKYGLKPVGYIESELTELRWLPKGPTVGYGGAYRTRRPTRIAVIPVGYYDGYCMEKAKDSFRALDVLHYIWAAVKALLARRRLTVTIGEAHARVVGHVGMIHTTCDVTKLSCSPGDVVKLPCSPLYTQSLPRKYVE